MSQVLITGGAGFIGLHLARQLLDQGDSVVIVDNFDRAAPDIFLKTLSEHRRCSVHEMDLTRDAFPPIDVDVIIHLAAIVGVQNVLNRPLDVLSTNTASLMRVLDYGASVSSLRHFIFTSTSEVYSGAVSLGGAKVPTPEKTPLLIQDPSDPRGTYSLSKIYGEALCVASGLPMTIVRPHNIYGPRMGMAHVIPQLLNKAWHCAPGETLEVSSVHHTRSFCHIHDAVRYLLAILDLPASSKVFNLGTQEPEISIGALAEIIIDVVGKDLTVRPLPPTPGSPERRAPDMSSLISHTGVHSEISLSVGINQTLEWYRKHVFSHSSGIHA